MIESVIHWSLRNRWLVLLATGALAAGGLFAVSNTPVDAIPDLSDVQVIVKTSYPGQAPQVVEDQVTYPLTSYLLSVPGAVTVRGFSFFGDSYVYVVFDEGTDLYWARSRVQEYLSQVMPSLPDAATAQLGPDATGVGWVYLYALVDRSGRHDLGELRALQDWFLKFELQSLPGVAEVATVGGMVRQYQVTVDPEKLRAYGLPLQHIREAIARSNQELGASVIEMAEAEYMVRITGYIQSLDDLASVPLGISNTGAALQLGDVADIGLGPQMRRGVTDLNGEGEAVGAVVVMRSGQNARQTIERVTARLQELRSGLPEGVELVTVYDRSNLIERAIDNLWTKLLQELAVVGLVCLLFLFHLRSSLVAVISLPLAILAAFIVMRWQGLNANIMSLGGFAIAIGAMVDGAIVMIENVHKHLGRKRDGEKTHWQLVTEATTEVGPALFYSLLIITVSFVPVFALEAQEGRMFTPLAYTKTYAMAASAALAITLVPVLLGYFARGRIPAERNNPIYRLLTAAYRPALRACLRFPKAAIAGALLLCASSLWPLQHIGSEFMPELDEGDLMYMPTTYAGISIGEARQVLQTTNKLISTVPEVKTVFGKAGRAETATDPAPLTMIETFIQLKDRSQWRPGMTTEKLIATFNELVSLPGLSNAWVMPIKTRIDMLATGIKTPLGIKVAGPELESIEAIGKSLEQILEQLPGTASVYSERVFGGRYIKVDIDRQRAARYGMNIAEVQRIVAQAVGGANVTETLEGRERYPVNLRYPQSYRDSPEALANLPMVTQQGEHIVLADVARIYLQEGPAAIKTENARLNGWVYVDIAGMDVGRYVQQAMPEVEKKLQLPPGYSIKWSGQYESMQRVKQKLTLMVPLTMVIIGLLLFLCFRQLLPVVVLMLLVPPTLTGSIWLMYWLDFNFSVAVGVGMIALAGVAVETGVIMWVFLDQAMRGALSGSRDQPPVGGQQDATEQLKRIVEDGALRRVRPLVMTALATILGLVPIMLGTGTGSEVMKRMAAPMVGGMISTLVLTLLILPCVYFLCHSYRRGRVIEPRAPR